MTDATEPRFPIRGWRARRARLTELRAEARRSEAELAALKEELAGLKARGAELKQERARLVAERTELLTTFAEKHGRKFKKLSNFERHLDTASFVVAQRMHQRIQAHADDPAAGIDGVGAVFADPGHAGAFLASHGIAHAPGPVVEPLLCTHAFHGEVGLVELREGERVRHLLPDGEDVGDVRPAFTHDPGLLPPADLAAVVTAAETLSRHVPRPYVQVFWTASAEVVAVDVDPDRIPVLTPEWDERLGLLLDRAHARVMVQPLQAGALASRVPGGVFEPEDPS